MEKQQEVEVFFIQRRVNDETDILAEKCSDNEI